MLADCPCRDGLAAGKHRPTDSSAGPASAARAAGMLPPMWLRSPRHVAARRRTGHPLPRMRYIDKPRQERMRHGTPGAVGIDSYWRSHQPLRPLIRRGRNACWQTISVGRHSCHILGGNAASSREQARRCLGQCLPLYPSFRTSWQMGKGRRRREDNRHFRPGERRLFIVQNDAVKSNAVQQRSGQGMNAKDGGAIPSGRFRPISPPSPHRSRDNTAGREGAAAYPTPPTRQSRSSRQE